MAQTVEDLAEILDIFKRESEENAQKFDKLLASINNKLNEIASDNGEEDLIKMYLSELKSLVEERHSMVSAEFSKIQNSFDNLNVQQSAFAKSDEIRNLSEDFSQKVQQLTQNLENQREIFNRYDERFTNFTNDKSDKTEIINSISAVKQDLEIVNQEFSTVANEIGGNIQTVLKNLVVMDPTAQNDIVKRELENIYIATNSILTAIHAVEQKNDDITQHFDNLITRENYAQSQEKLDNLARKSEEIALRLSVFPTKDEISALDNKLETLNTHSQISDLRSMTEGVQNTLQNSADKNDIQHISEQIQGVVQGFDNLYVRDEINNIIAKASQIQEQLNTLPQQGDLADMYKSIQDFSMILDNLRTNLTQSNQNIESEIREKLDNFQHVLNSIVTEHDFANFKTDLNNFIEQTLTRFSQINENLSNHKETIENLTEKISSSEISKNIDTLTTVVSEITEVSKSAQDKLSGVETSVQDFRASAGSNAQNIISLLNNITEKFENISDEEIKNKVDNIKTEIIDASEKLSKIDTNQIEILEKLSESSDYSELFALKNNLSAIETAIDGFRNTSSDNVKHIVEEISNIYHRLEDFSTNEVRVKFDNLNNILAENAGKIEQLTGLQNDILDKLNWAQSLQSQNNETNSVSGEIADKIADDIKNLENIVNEFKLAAESNRDLIIEQISKLALKTDENRELSEQIENFGFSLKNINDEIKANQSEIMDKLSEDNSEKFTSINQNIEFLKETMMSIDASSDASLTEKLLSLREIINENSNNKDNTLSEIKDKIDNYFRNIGEISKASDEKLNNSLAEISDLKEDIQNISKQFEDWNNNSENDNNLQLINQITENLENITAIMGVLQDNIKAGVHQELSETSMTLEQRMSDLSMYLDNLKTEFSDNQMQNEEFIKELKDRITAVVQEINLANTDIIDTLNTKAQVIFSELAPLKEMFGNSSDVGVSIVSKISELNEIQNEKIGQLLSDIYQDIDKELSSLSEVKEAFFNSLSEFDGKISEKISSSVNEFNEKTADRIHNAQSEIINNFETNVSDLKQDIDAKLNSQTAELSQLIYASANSDKSSTVGLEALNDLKTQADSGNKKITELLDILNQKVDILAMSEDNAEIFEEIGEIKDLISSQKDSLDSLTNNKNQEEIEKNLTELVDKINSLEKTDLKDMRETILSTILNVFDQISFIEESEDIKDFVEEKTDEINKNLSEMKRKLDDMANTDGDYTYTLQDVETDIAKLRVVLNEMSDTSSKEEISDISYNIQKIISTVTNLENSLTQEQIIDLKSDFEKLNDDIISISTRTNKLLLNSDESTNALNDFTNMINNLQERLTELDNKDITERIEQKVNELYGSDKVIRQALIYMGEWIDNTSEKIDNLQESLDSIQSENPDIEKLIQKNNEMMEEIRNSLNNQDNFAELLNEKFEEQQERMDRIEMKLERILQEIGEIDDSKVIKKADKLDKQLSKITKNIEKLTSYVE